MGGQWVQDSGGQFYWVDEFGNPGQPPAGAPPNPSLGRPASGWITNGPSPTGNPGAVGRPAPINAAGGPRTAPIAPSQQVQQPAAARPTYQYTPNTWAGAPTPAQVAGQTPSYGGATVSGAAQPNMTQRIAGMQGMVNTRAGVGQTPSPGQTYLRNGQPNPTPPAPHEPSLDDVYNAYTGYHDQAAGRLTDLKGDIDRQNGLINSSITGMQQNDAQRFANTQNANQLDFGYLRDYEGQVGATNASNNQYMGDLNSLYDSMSTPLQARGYGANVQSDAQSMGMQNQAWGQLQGAANGSLDYQSQAAQAYADAQLVQQQQAAYNRLNGIADGSLDIAFDPALRAKQNQALDQYDDWRNPRLTAQEEFMKEQARLEQEQSEGASRRALADKFARQGMGGSGMELQMVNQAGQQNSENRLLSDLGANANAIARAERSLQGFAELSSGMQDQDTSLKQFNTGTRLNASGMASDAARGLRQDDFGEKYARGQAADTASANNQSTRLGGMQSSAQLATDMRTQADTMSRFNKEQSLIQQRYQDTYAQTERDSSWDRGVQRADMGIGTNQTNLNNNSNLINTRTGINDAAWRRSDGTLKDSDASKIGQVNMGQIGVNNTGNWVSSVNQNDASWGPLIGGVRTSQVGDKIGQDEQDKLVNYQVNNPGIDFSKYRR